MCEVRVGRTGASVQYMLTARIIGKSTVDSRSVYGGVFLLNNPGRDDWRIVSQLDGEVCFESCTLLHSLESSMDVLN